MWISDNLFERGVMRHQEGTGYDEAVSELDGRVKFKGDSYNKKGESK
jgi:hypothetical protein